MKLNFNDQKDALLSQCVRKGSFLGICENDHKLLGHSSLVTPNFWPLPSQKNPVKHRGGFCFTAFFCSQKKSCHLPNKNVVSGLHQRPPLLDPRKERKSKAWVEFVCLRIPLTIVFDASLNYVSRSPLSKWVPCLVTFSSLHALQLKKNPEERKTVENLGKEMGACAILEFKRRLADGWRTTKKKGARPDL